MSVSKHGAGWRKGIEEWVPKMRREIWRHPRGQVWGVDDGYEVNERHPWAFILIANPESFS